jgi:hypothetical protein
MGVSRRLFSMSGTGTTGSKVFGKEPKQTSYPDREPSGRGDRYVTLVCVIRYIDCLN